MDPLVNALRDVRWWVRGVLGADAYDRYLDHHRRCAEEGGAAGHGPTGPPMTEREFWRARTDHQERNPQGRCC
ncbi:MAG TPA: YbdD/YjiX family protein [Pseudonocardia sp.]